MELMEPDVFCNPYIKEYMEGINEFGLIYYASDAAMQMEFRNVNELHEAVKRAMELCLHAGIPVESNFKRIYRCSSQGIEYDWKLSHLAYKMVSLNGNSSNPLVARMQIDLLNR